MDPQPEKQPRLILIPMGRTEWDEHGRLAGAADLPLSEAGARQVDQLAEQLAGQKLELICVSASQTAKQTAAILSDKLGVAVKTVKGLEDLDVGLWEGLTSDQLKQRYPRVYKQWVEQPASVRPPQGEHVQEAAERLLAAVVQISTKSKVETIGVVFGRLAIAAVRCRLADESLDNLWQKVEDSGSWYSLSGPAELSDADNGE